MDWSSLAGLIPTSLLALGAPLLLVGYGLVFLDVPGKGVPWDKVGAWFCLIGGFTVGGSAAGAIGSGLGSLAGGGLNAAQRMGVQALGVSITVGLFALVGLWVYARVKGKGLATKSKLKSFVLASVIALAGTVLAAIPNLYSGIDHVYSEATTTLVSGIREA